MKRKMVYPAGIILHPPFSILNYCNKKTEALRLGFLLTRDNSVYLYSPAQLIRQLAPLDAGQGVVQLVGNFADLTVVDVSNIALVAQLANRRDNCSGTGAEYLFQLAVVGSLHNVSDRQALLGYRNAPVLEQLDAAHTGNARQNGANSRS